MLLDSTVEAAGVAHRRHWRATSDECTGDRQATAVTKAWQKAVESDNVWVEVSIADHLQERIDVVDLSTTTAYELKASGKNPHHEFYKDIFKVIVYNQHHERRLERLVFITEQIGADKLNRGLGQAVIDSAGQFDVPIMVVGI